VASLPATLTASPGLKAGRGLKLCELFGQPVRIGASPGLKAGRGLKLLNRKGVNHGLLHRPASRPGAD